MSKRRTASRDNTLPKKVGITIVGRQHNTDVWAVASNMFIDGKTGMYFLACHITIVYYPYSRIVHCIITLPYLICRKCNGQR